MAAWLDATLPDNCKILVSPALRTQETIAPLAALNRKFKLMPELAPDSNAASILQAANWPNASTSVLIVGHQPTLGEVASHLITPHQPHCAIRKGNVWWITQKDRDGEGLSTYLKCIMTPDLVIR